MNKENDIPNAPRISSNQLAKYVFSAPAERLRILRSQKFKEPGRAAYYSPCELAILRSLENGQFDEALLNQEWEELQQTKPGKWHRDRWNNNREMLDRFTSIHHRAHPSPGEHDFPRKNTLIKLNGVNISVRPEIFSRNNERKKLSFTKLRFSKSKFAEDAAEIALLLLIKYGNTNPVPGLAFDLENSKVIDCFSKTIIHGHAVNAKRENQLDEALRDILQKWDSILKQDDHREAMEPHKNIVHSSSEQAPCFDQIR